MKETLLKALREQDAARPRSQQTQIGVSEIGGCARQLWYKVNGQERTNHDTLALAAMMGTAVHAMIETAFAGRDGYLIEAELEHDGVKGHIDLIDLNENALWDWKTTTKSALGYFPSAQQRAQVQLYGWLCNNNGYAIKTVGLLAIPRDGNENDIVEYSEPYSEAVALDYLDRLTRIKGEFEPPAPEKDAAFCRSYCHFYGVCPGKAEAAVGQPIENDEVVLLVKEYRAAADAKKEAEARLDFLKEALTGTEGVTPDGTVVKWSQVAGRMTVDEEAVAAAMGVVPKKQGAGYARLTVK